MGLVDSIVSREKRSTEKKHEDRKLPKHPTGTRGGSLESEKPHKKQKRKGNKKRKTSHSKKKKVADPKASEGSGSGYNRMIEESNRDIGNDPRQKFCLRNNTAYAGDTLRKSFAYNLKECEINCQRTPGCKKVHFHGKVRTMCTKRR